MRMSDNDSKRTVAVAHPVLFKQSFINETQNHTNNYLGLGSRNRIDLHGPGIVLFAFKFGMPAGGA